MITRNGNGDLRKKRLSRMVHYSVCARLCTGLSTLFFLTNVHAEIMGSQYGQNITVNDGDKIIGDRGDASGSLYGVINPVNSTGTINLGKDVDIAVTDPDRYAKGVLIQGDNSTLTASGLSVAVTGKSAVGLDLSGNHSTANLGTGSQVAVEGSAGVTATGISLENASSLTADNLAITTSGNNGIGLSINNYGSSADLGNNSAIITSGSGSAGVYIAGLNGTPGNGDASLTANALTISTQGSSAYGLNIQQHANVDLGSHSTITTSGQYADGIWSFGNVTASALTVDATGNSANGVEVRNGLTSIGAGSTVSSAQGGALVANGNQALLTFSGTEENRNTLIAGGSYGASAQSTGATIDLTNTDIFVDRNGKLALGLWALGGGNITGHNISVTGAAGTAGVYAMTDSTIDLTGDLKITMSSPDQVAIATQHNEGYNASQITASGKMAINGSVQATGGQIDLNLDPDSVWVGSAYSDNVNNGWLNVSMSHSLWNVSGTSNLDNLNLDNATVDFSSSLSGDEFKTLTVSNLSGSGAFVMRTDIVGEGEGVNNAGDKLVVTGKSAGDYLLTILNRGSLATTGNEVLTVVETADGQASFTSASDVELGGYLYTVRKNGTHWELYSSGSAQTVTEPETGTDDTTEGQPATQPDTSSPTDPEEVKDEGTSGGSDEAPGTSTPGVPDDGKGSPTEDGTGQPANEGSSHPSDSASGAPITHAADAGANFLNVNYLLNFAETQTLMQRMGDIRQGEAAGDAWLRGLDGKFISFSSGKLSQFAMRYSGFQFGFDKRLSPEIPLYLGTFMGITRGSPTYQSGDGTVQSHHAGFYSTYKRDDGFYIDGILKFNRLKNQFNVLDSQKNRVGGEAAASGITASVEAGKRFALPTTLSGFYLEPQFQLSWGQQDGASLQSSNGLKIDLESYHSLIGRASTLFGYELMDKDNRVNLYFKTGWVREYEGDTGYRLNDSAESHSFKGNWWNSGLGVSAQLNKQHVLFADVDVSTGSKFNQRQVNAGYRYSF